MAMLQLMCLAHLLPMSYHSLHCSEHLTILTPSSDYRLSNTVAALYKVQRDHTASWQPATLAEIRTLVCVSRSAPHFHPHFHPHFLPHFLPHFHPHFHPHARLACSGESFLSTPHPRPQPICLRNGVLAWVGLASICEGLEALGREGRWRVQSPSWSVKGIDE